MEKSDEGIFSMSINADLDGYFYTYLVNGNEVSDPSAENEKISRSAPTSP